MVCYGVCKSKERSGVIDLYGYLAERVSVEAKVKKSVKSSFPHIETNIRRSVAVPFPPTGLNPSHT